MKDRFGREIREGHAVAFIQHTKTSSSLELGVVVGLTPKLVSIECETGRHRGDTLRKSPYKVIVRGP